MHGKLERFCQKFTFDDRLLAQYSDNNNFIS